MILDDGGEYSRAEHHYSRAVELCPDQPDHVFDYATFLAASGRHDDAESYFSKARAVGHETATADDSYEAFVDAQPWDTQFASKDGRLIRIHRAHASNCRGYHHTAPA